MDWYYKGLKEIIDHIIYNYGSTWIIISHKEIVIEMTIECIGYEYINNKWTEIEMIIQARIRVTKYVLINYMM